MKEDIVASLFIGGVALVLSVVALGFSIIPLLRAEKLDPKIYTSSDGYLYQEIEKGVYSRVVAIIAHGGKGGEPGQPGEAGEVIGGSGPGASSGDVIVVGYGEEGTDPGGEQATRYIRVCNGEVYVRGVARTPCDPKQL